METTGLRKRFFLLWYCPTKDGEDKWVPMPHLNEIRYGLGDAVWYDESSEEEAGEWMDRIKNG